MLFDIVKQLYLWYSKCVPSDENEILKMTLLTHEVSRYMTTKTSHMLADDFSVS